MLGSSEIPTDTLRHQSSGFSARLKLLLLQLVSYTVMDGVDNHNKNSRASNIQRQLQEINYINSKRTKTRESIDSGLLNLKGLLQTRAEPFSANLFDLHRFRVSFIRIYHLSFRTI